MNKEKTKIARHDLEFDEFSPFSSYILKKSLMNPKGKGATTNLELPSNIRPVE